MSQEEVWSDTMQELPSATHLAPKEGTGLPHPEDFKSMVEIHKSPLKIFWLVSVVIFKRQEFRHNISSVKRSTNKRLQSHWLKNILQVGSRILLPCKINQNSLYCSDERMYLYRKSVTVKQVKTRFEWAISKIDVLLLQKPRRLD